MEVTDKMFEDSSAFGTDGSFDIHIGFNDAEETVEAPAETAEVSTEGTVAAQPDTESETPTIETEDRVFNFTAKLDHKEEQVSVKESDLPTLYQKSQNMDRANKRAEEAQAEVARLRAKMNEYAATAAATMSLEGNTSEEVLDAMTSTLQDTAVKAKVQSMGRDVNQELADDYAKRNMKDGIDSAMKKFEGSKTATETPVEPSATASAPTVPSNEQFLNDLNNLVAERPEIKESAFPTEVIQNYKFHGMSLREAYLLYENKQNAAETQKLREQNAVLQQNQASAKRAPVRRGVGSSGSTSSNNNPLKAGFNDPLW